MSKKKIIIGVIVIVVLGFGYHTISPLFIHVRVDEALPQATQSLTTNETMLSAPIVGTTGHPASGLAKIIKTGDKTFLRYEDFKTINGPDLYIYLATDLEAKDFVNLGRLKATEGNVNYEIPAGVDITKYRYALIWCKAFGVLFSSADLSNQGGRSR